MALDAAFFAELYAPRVGVLPEAILVERVMALSGDTEADVRQAFGFGVPLADFTITRGADPTPWWSRRGGESIGDAAGDLEIVPGVSVDRVQWNRDGQFRLIFNTDGDPQPWVAGSGANATVVVTIGGGTISLNMADREGLGTWGFRWRLANPARQVAGSLQSGHQARIVIDEP